MKAFYLSLVFFLSFFAINAQVSAPKYSNEFLNIGVGARNLGMGNASISNLNNVTAGYWNPSGLLKSENKMEFGLMHSEYFAGIAKYDYLGYSYRIDSQSVAGISLIRFGVDDIPNTTELIDKDGNVDYDRITTFSAADYGVLLSYARRLPLGIDVGGNFKIIHRKIGDFAQAWGFGLDASASYKYKDWDFAAILRDVTTTVNAWSFNISDEVKAVFDSTNNEIPQNSTELTIPRLIVGGSRYFKLNKTLDLTTEANLDFTFDGKRNTFLRTGFTSMTPKIGLEIGYKKAVYFRTGVNNFQWVKQVDDSEKLNIQPNIGVGIQFKGIAVDYALTNLGNSSVSLYSNIFSLRYGF